MKVELTVRVDGQYWRGGAAIEVPELYAKSFERLKTCDDPRIAYVTGEAVAGSEVARAVMKTRDDAAKLLAEQLAEMIVREMQRNDTHNGYKIQNPNIHHQSTQVSRQPEE